MTNLFHVKPDDFSPRRGFRWASVACWTLLLAGQSVWADVHKCTAPDGRVIFSDQPCAAGQVGGKTRFGAVTNPVTPPPPAAKDASAQSREAMRTRMSAGLTPECRTLRDRVTRYLEQGNGQTPEAVVNADMARFEQHCATQIRDSIQAEMDLKAAERKILEAQQVCQEKRRVIDVRRTQRTSLSAPDQQALNQLESEVARDCR